jgi:hypothetical protein
MIAILSVMVQAELLKEDYLMSFEERFVETEF